MAKLGELYKITSGGTPSRTHSEYYEDGTIPWVKTGDLKDKYLFETDEKISQLGLENSSARIYLKNTVLLAMYGATIGATSILKIDAATNQACAAFSPREDTLPEYLYAFLESQKDKFIKDAVGGAQPNLSAGYLKTIEFKLPSLEQQTRITRNLSKIDELLLLRKQQIAKLDELVKVRFVEMFGEPVSNPYKFEVRSLQNMLDDGIITYHLDGNHGSDYPRNEEFVESGVSYISANCIIDDTVNLNLAKHLTEERAAKLRKGIAQDEDVLFAHNATVGPVAILHTRETKVILGTSLTAYRCNKQRILPAYLKAYMQSEGFVRQYTKDMKQTTRNQVPITAQRKYLFIVPPLSLQNQFAAFVERVDQQKQTVQQSLEKLELMKKALMQEYFG